MSFLQITREIPQVGPDVVFSVGGFPVTNSFLMILLIASLLAFIALFLIRHFSLQPTRAQNVIEMLYESMRVLIDQITGDVRHSNAIFPLVATLFVYIGISNMIGLVPGITNFTFLGIPLLRTPTTDFNVTLGLALAMVVLLNILSLRRWGPTRYLGKFFRVKEIFIGFKKSFSDGFIAIIGFFVGLLDIVSEFAKIISLSLRLFGNMYAGTVLATIVLGAVAFVLPSAWLGLSLLFAIVQAMVFGALVTAYYMLAVKGGEE